MKEVINFEQVLAAYGPAKARPHRVRAYTYIPAPAAKRTTTYIAPPRPRPELFGNAALAA